MATNKEIVEKVVQAFNEYYMDESRNGYNALFARFASKHAHHFEGDFDAGDE